MSTIRRSTLTGLLTLGVLAGGSLLFSAPTLAGEALGIAATFGSSTSSTPDPEPLSGPSGVAVNQSTEDVYVVDQSNHRVERFSPSGEYEAQFNAPGGFSSPSAIAIDNACFYQKLLEPACKKEHPSNGDVYVLDSGYGVIDKFSAKGSFIPPQTPASGLADIAEDSSGNLWVLSSGESVGGVNEEGKGVDSFSWTSPVGGSILAVDSDDNVYVAFALEQLGRFNRKGEELVEPGIYNVSALAVDLETNDLYVAKYSSLTQYGPFGEPWAKPLYGSSARSAMADARGIAVNSTSHQVYVTDSSKSLVDVFNVGTTATEPKTGESEVKGSVVTLEGKLEGGESGYYFAYNDNGGSCEGGGRTPEGKASGVAKESATIERGLESNTQYKFCIVATNPYGQPAGLPSTFTTGVEPPVVEGASAPYVGVFEATLQATVHPENQTVSCRVEYGKTGEGYGPPAPCEPASLSGRGGQPAALEMKGLLANTTYHYRVVAENTAGETNGPSEGTGHFTTAPALEPVIEAQSASVESGKEAEPRAATLQAQVNPELQPTTSCVFQYAKSGESYGAGVPCEQSAQQIGKGGVAVPVSLKLTGLQAGVDYHYRVVVGNETGTSEGEDHVFGPPTVVTGAVLSKVPGTTATVGGEVNPEELDTRYYVQYGETEAYGQIAPYLPPGHELLSLGLDAGSGSKPVVLGSSGICGLPCQAPPDVQLEGLAAGALYHYRLVAYNADGTTYGAPMTVKVLPAPQVGPASVSEVTQESATISTSVNPEGLHTVYELEVGTSTAYGTPYPGDAGSGSAPVPLTFKLSGLHAGDTYHFRLEASNSDGTSSEADQTFTTAAAVVKAPLELIKGVPELGLVSFTAIAFPTETGTTTPKSLTRAQKLANALKACKRKPKSKRAACIKQAHKRYMPVKKASKGAHKSR
ncbi:MAG: hypothetical protein ACHQC8_01790 [Solirubrobacterales bacterium]